MRIPRESEADGMQQGIQTLERKLCITNQAVTHKRRGGHVRVFRNRQQLDVLGQNRPFDIRVVLPHFCVNYKDQVKALDLRAQGPTGTRQHAFEQRVCLGKHGMLSKRRLEHRSIEHLRKLHCQLPREAAVHLWSQHEREMLSLLNPEGEFLELLWIGGYSRADISQFWDAVDLTTLVGQ